MDPNNRLAGHTVTSVTVSSISGVGAGQLVSVEVTEEGIDSRGIPNIHYDQWTEPLDALLGASLDHEESVLLADEERNWSQAEAEQAKSGTETPETVKQREELKKRRVQHVEHRLSHLRPDSQLRDFAGAVKSIERAHDSPESEPGAVDRLMEETKEKVSAKVASDIKSFKEGPAVARPPPLLSGVLAQQLGDDSRDAAEAVYERFPGARTPPKQARRRISHGEAGITPWTTRAEIAKLRKPVGPDWRKQSGVSDPGTKDRSVPATPRR